ncbi:alpha/beta hydrolase [Robbsia sp. Bb-Pol-6]|uniref:Alpha/beta hydrolase n=1 Tax=Robbsia betulipollinis TaxID=2981849 RepID=A0ABT3ZIQ5_9BURK|nr:alpha/beta hydrolase [Robbsia betulipollinis]MCY0386237.1 alpha/beta hydrolase [Robbsia betulipollinis]
MTTRRSFVKLSLGAALFPALLPAASFAAERQIIRLWPDAPPGGGGPDGDERVGKHGGVSNIRTPSLEVFLPAQANGAAVLVAGGGGYKRIQMATEAHPAAAWLVARGFTVFVLTYRLPGEGWHAGPAAPLQDAQRALRIIRAQADRYGVHRDRIGLLGFSAGGHLLGLAATRPAFASYPAGDAIDREPARAHAAALIYPVVTLAPPYDRTSTRRELVGNDPSPALGAEWSVETHVKADCPPMFLVQAEDDPISNPANTVIMAQACQRANVPVELHRLPSGGHGFGMGHAGSPTAMWPDWYEAWLKRFG